MGNQNNALFWKLSIFSILLIEQKCFFNHIIDKRDEAARPGRTSTKGVGVKGVSRRLYYSYLGFNGANRLLRSIKQVYCSVQGGEIVGDEIAQYALLYFPSIGLSLKNCLVLRMRPPLRSAAGGR